MVSQIGAFANYNLSPFDDFCTKYSVESLVVSCENAAIEVVLLLGIPFVCTSCHAAYHSIVFEVIGCEWINRSWVQNKSFGGNNKSKFDTFYVSP